MNKIIRPKSIYIAIFLYVVCTIVGVTANHLLNDERENNINLFYFVTNPVVYLFIKKIIDVGMYIWVNQFLLPIDIEKANLYYQVKEIAYSVGYITSTILTLALTFFLAYKIYNRTRWARILLLIFYLLWLIFFLTARYRIPKEDILFFYYGLSLSILILTFISLILLFIPSSNRWFKTKN